LLLPDAPVSIDIGSYSVKVAQLSGGRGGVRTLRCAEQPLPADFHWDPGSAAAPLMEAIRLAMRTAGIRTRRAIISLPRRHVTARISAFPPADRAQLQRVVEYDLADHIPFPVEQVIVDFQPLGPSFDQPGMVDVLVVAAQRDLVRQYLDLAKALGLRLSALTVDAFALHDLVALRRVQRDSAPGLCLALEIGRRSTLINVSDGARLRLTRSVPLGGLQLTTALRDEFGLSPEEAELRKQEEGLDLLERAPRPSRLAAWLDNLRGEMRRSALSFGPAAIARIFLTGATAQTPGLAKAIEAEFGVSPARLSPLTLFPTAQLRGADAATAERCLLAIGQGLRALGRSAFTISLVPREVGAARRAAAGQRLGALAGLTVIALLTMSYLSAKANVEQQGVRKTLLQKQLDVAKLEAKQATAFVEERDRLRTKLATLDPARAQRYAALELLRTISEGANKDIVLFYFALRPDQPLLLRGTAPNSAAAADLQAYLLKSPLVTRVSLDRVDRLQQPQGGPAVRRLRQKETKEAPKVKQEERVNFIMTVHLWTEKAPKQRRLIAGGAR